MTDQPGGDELDQARALADALWRALDGQGIEEDSYFDLASLTLPPIVTRSGPIDERRKRQLSIELGLARGVQGTSRISRERGGKDVADATLSGAKAVLDALSQKARLTREEVNQAILAAEADESRVLNVLKLLELVAGAKGQTGGIRRPDVALDDYSNAERHLATVELQEQGDSDDVREHESVYYPAAADALRLEGFESCVTGVRQRARGEWSTPDVVGFYVKPMTSLVSPVVRTGTVEVKHRLTRSGIAEAAAHKRFANYVYVAVPQVFGDIAAELREECVRSGIGLMCFRQRNSVNFSVFLEPVMGRPDEELVDELLSSMRNEEQQHLSDLVSDQIRRAMGQGLFK